MPSPPVPASCWCWQASSHGESLSTTPRHPLVWGKIRQVLHHHCVENNINSDVKYGIRIQSRLSWGIFSVLQIRKMLNDIISHTWAARAEGQSALELFILAAQSASRQVRLPDGEVSIRGDYHNNRGHLDKAPRCRRATRVFRPVKVLIKVTNFDICSKNLADIGVWYPWRDAPLLLFYLISFMVREQFAAKKYRFLTLHFVPRDKV